MNNYDIVAQAVIEYWKNTIPQVVIAFFYQKYDFESEWEWCEELIEPYGANDYETVLFQYDFWEGQTQIKDIKIVPLDEITTFYAEQHKLKSPEV